MGKCEDPKLTATSNFIYSFRHWQFDSYLKCCSFLNDGTSFLFLQNNCRKYWSEIVTAKTHLHLLPYSVTQTHLRQPTSDAEVAQPMDGMHHTSTSSSSSSSSFSGIQIRCQHAHTATVTFHLAGPSAARVPPQLPLCGWVCAPGAVLRRLGWLQRVMNHLAGDGRSVSQSSKCVIARWQSNWGDSGW